MLMFLATLSTSVAALLLVQVMDIECVNPPKRRPSRSQGVKTEAAYPNGAVVGALR